MDFSIEELSMNAWPAIRSVLYDGWIIRMSKGYTKRANSVNMPYPSLLRLDDKIWHCGNLYAAAGLPAIFKIVDCSEHCGIDKRLESCAYEKQDPTSVQICERLEFSDKPARGIVIDPKFNRDWLEGFFECSNIKQDDKGTIRTMLGNITGNIIAVRMEKDGETIGCGYGVIERGFAGLFDIVVKEGRRGNGYGGEIVRSLLSEAKKQGAEKSYLQVVDSNIAAKQLYRKLGFREIYKYWYRKKDTARL